MVTHSKIRNCFGEQWKEKYQDLRMSSKTAEGQPIAASTDLIAVTWEVAGGGAIGVVRSNALNVRKPNVTMFRGHKGAIQDVEFSPFFDSIFATASEDTTVKVWEVLPEGAVNVKQDSIATLGGHEKKALYCTFNPVADWILASGSADASAKIWDVENEKNSFSARHPDYVTGVAWNSTGSLLATTCRDKKLRVLDPRQQQSFCEVMCHDGTKAAKPVWLGGMHSDDHLLCTAGLSKGAARELALWDIRKSAEPVVRHTIDRGSGTIIPIWDENSGVLYLPGKGDGNIRLTEVVDNSSFSFLTEFRSSNPCKACNFVPKRGVDVMRCEIARALRTEGSNVIQPVSFVVPRKSTEFQADLFPDCRSGEPSLNGANWLKGQNGEPIRKSMQPDEKGNSPFLARVPVYKIAAATGADSSGSSTGSTEESNPKETVVSTSPAVLKRELTRAGSKIAELNQEVTARESTAKTLTSDNDKLSTQLEDKNREIHNLKSELTGLKGRVTELEQLFVHCHNALHTAASESADKK